jgi:hypothetical protein
MMLQIYLLNKLTFFSLLVGKWGKIKLKFKELKSQCCILLNQQSKARMKKKRNGTTGKGIIIYS